MPGSSGKARHAQAQLVLLQLQKLDSERGEVDRLLREEPEKAELTALSESFAHAGEALRVAVVALEDVQSALSRIEQDVHVVTARQAQDRTRLDQTSSPKEAHSLSAELETLGRRLDALEESQLELMEEEERRRAALDTIRAEREEIRDRGRALQDEAPARLAQKNPGPVSNPQGLANDNGKGGIGPFDVFFNGR